MLRRTQAEKVENGSKAEMTSPAQNTAKAWPAVEDQSLQIRIDLAAAYRLIHRLGLDDSIYTHISARLPGRQDRFLINPYGLRFEEVTASNLVTVDLDGHVIDDPWVSASPGRLHDSQCDPCRAA
jgi:mannose/cellobiose epimerase-like protein (N-acyl-D-glucosamine 2-epimerase family)